MSKTVRIENADTSNYKVKVDIQDQVWDAVNNVWLDQWITTKTIGLDQPTAILSDCLTSTRRMIVREEPA